MHSEPHSSPLTHEPCRARSRSNASWAAAILGGLTCAVSLAPAPWGDAVATAATRERREVVYRPIIMAAGCYRQCQRNLSLTCIARHQGRRRLYLLPWFSGGKGSVRLPAQQSSRLVLTGLMCHCLYSITSGVSIWTVKSLVVR
jgi:hypothetical protein